MSFPPKIQDSGRCIGGSREAVSQDKEIKVTLIVKEEVKLSLLAYNLVAYVENLMESSGKLLETISVFRKIVRC